LAWRFSSFLILPLKLNVDGRAEQLLESLNVVGQSLAAGLSHAVKRLRLAQDEFLFDRDVAGLF